MNITVSFKVFLFKFQPFFFKKFSLNLKFRAKKNVFQTSNITAYFRLLKTTNHIFKPIELSNAFQYLLIFEKYKHI